MHSVAHKDGAIKFKLHLSWQQVNKNMILLKERNALGLRLNKPPAARGAAVTHSVYVDIMCGLVGRMPTDYSAPPRRINFAPAELLNHLIAVCWLFKNIAN